MNLYKILVSALMLIPSPTPAQIKNAKTETLSVHGSCDMCEQTIEKAATEGIISKGSWNKDTQQLTLTYDADKTTADAILKKVAYAGYDNEKYLAPSKAYAKLPGCCRYERPVVAAQEPAGTDNGDEIRTMAQPVGEASLLAQVYTAYFNINDALVKSDPAAAATAASAFATALGKVPMEKMGHATHQVWMEKLPALEKAAGSLSRTKDIAKQRGYFATLSELFYTVTKAFGPEQTLYYQHCPMYNGGANWLSRDKAIKNPYYGSKMLSCGNTQETLNP